MGKAYKLRYNFLIFFVGEQSFFRLNNVSHKDITLTLDLLWPTSLNPQTIPLSSLNIQKNELYLRSFGPRKDSESLHYDNVKERMVKPTSTQCE